MRESVFLFHAGAEKETQEILATMNSIEKFLAAKTYAVAGASNRQHKYGNKVFSALLAAGRETYPLNPAQDEIEGHQAYPSIAGPIARPRSTFDHHATRSHSQRHRRRDRGRSKTRLDAARSRRRTGQRIGTRSGHQRHRRRQLHSRAIGSSIMTQDTVKIRIATEQDRDAILAVHMNAFGEGEGPVIAKLVDEMLDDASGEPMLSLVAETDDGLVGHLLFTSVKIEPDDSQVSARILAPLAVVQNRQSQGIGGRLIKRDYASWPTLASTSSLSSAIPTTIHASGSSPLVSRVSKQPTRSHLKTQMHGW